MSPKPVLVVGGGIAGIQAAIDLANMGVRVLLVEKNPSIGGRMAQLDKTFPTNDCSICILAPKMIECVRHDNIELLTYSEVERVTGAAGNFSVTIRNKARYVDQGRCTGCGDCIAACPVKVPDEFNMNLNKRKAIYLPFPQAVPRKMTIDKEHCLYLKKGRCRSCEKACQAKAIDYEQKDQRHTRKVGAIVLAWGFDLFDLATTPEYGYGTIPNVLSAMEFERLLCASGPTGGALKRPSDGATPHHIGFIQCVGSRDVRNNPYCSTVCCMHATKEAILANEHHPELESCIFYTDLRATGKGFQEFTKRAESEYKVQYIRSRPGKLTEEPDTRNVIVHYESTTKGKLSTLALDMVVLCQALIPGPGHHRLAGIMGVDVDERGFLVLPNEVEAPFDTVVPGIYACGFCTGPKDIPDSVVQASGAAMRAAEAVLTVGEKESKKRKKVKAK